MCSDGMDGRNPHAARCFLALLFAAVLVHAAAGQDVAGRGQTACERSLSIIRDQELLESKPQQIRNAMEELGRMKCAEAIHDLVALLTFRFPFPEEAKPLLQRVFTGTRYPATSALGQIGRPALPALVEVIETNDAASLESKNARWTVRAIFRFHSPAADKFFKEAADKARTPEAKQRLLHALETAEEDFRSD